MSTAVASNEVKTAPPGQEWLPSRPEDWHLKRMKAVFREIAVKGKPNLPLLAATQRMGVVRKETYGQRTVVAQHGLENLKVVDVDDFVISLRSFEGGIEVAHDRGIISPAYTVLRALDKAYHGYFRHLLKSRYFLDAIRLSVTGIREGQSINYTKLGCTFLPLPPRGDAALIARYLDHAELRIAKAIAGKSELLRLLDEQRFSVVVEEVLGRSREGAAIRSGLGSSEDRVLAWIGAVPSSWSMRQIAEVVSPVYCSNVGLPETRVLSLSYGRVVVKPEEKLRGLVPESFETYQIVNPGDIIIRPTDLQNDRTSLRVGQVEDRGIITSAYMALRPHPAENAKYVMLQLAAYDFMKVFYGYGAGLRQNLDFKHIKHIPMVIPGRHEQDEIVRQVEIQTGSLLQARSALLSEIALLKEYRTRLISDVVTGKIDVRKEAAKLPDIDPAELAAALTGGAAGADEEEVADGDD